MENKSIERKCANLEGKVERVKAIELMKAIAIVGMVLVHGLEPTVTVILDNIGEDAFIETSAVIPTVIIEILGGIISAGAFMFAMGWGAAYSKKTPADYLKRAGLLYILGLFVNFFEEYYTRLTAPEYYGINSLSTSLFVLFSVDIYFYAALCMIVFAFIRKLPSVKSKVLVSVLIMVISLFVNIYFPKGSLATGNVWIDTIFTDLLSRQNDYSYFPFVTWIAFPIMGYWAAHCFRNTESKKRYFTVVAITAAILIAVGQGVISANDMDPAALIPALATADTFYGMNIWNIACGCGLILGEMLLCFGIIKSTHNRLPEFVYRMSKNVILIYIIQWILHAILFKTYTQLTSVWVNVFISTCVLISSYWLAILVKRIYKH